MKTKILFKVIKHGSNDYKTAVALRESILRKPLGLSFSAEELEQEKEHIHIAGFLDEQLCATTVLVPEGEAFKMQRVVTDETLQGLGIGTAMMAFCEEYARTHGFKAIYCHARGTAIPFYLKNGYRLEGEPFDEDRIPHHSMRKTI